MVQMIVYISIVIYYLALGINLELKKLFYWNKPILFVLGIKFIVVPLITLIVLWLIPSEFLSLFDKKIVLIMSFMPGAVYSIVSSIIFNLNTRFTVQIFVLSTLIFLGMILPILYLTLT
jgi:predicted permease